MAQVIHVFHGFLGSPEDFKFLERADVVLHDVYEMDKFPKVAPEDTLIGYSMGGRIALEIAESVQYAINKIVLINSHPGLSLETERFARKNFEDSVLFELKNQDMDDFMAWWNELPIFRFDLPIKTSGERYRKSAAIFDRYRLSNQKDHLPVISQHADKVLWIIGSQDEKYVDIASDKLLPHDIEIKFIEAGHRLFQHPAELLQIFKDEKVL